MGSRVKLNHKGNLVTPAKGERTIKNKTELEGVRACDLGPVAKQ